MLLSPPLAVPDVQFSFFTEELRSQRCSVDEPGCWKRGAAREAHKTDSMGIGSLAATATSARSLQPRRRTS